MRWPWVSRLAYEAVKDERDRLRAVNDRLTEQWVGITRVKAGLREKPKAARVPEEVPPEVREYVERWDGEPVKRALYRQISHLRSSGKPWPEILTALANSIPDPS